MIKNKSFIDEIPTWGLCVMGLAGVGFFAALLGAVLPKSGDAATASSGILAGLMLTALGMLLYFLPTVLGWSKRDRASIFVVNLFLGWTLVGWVVALAWALKHEAPRPRISG